MMEATEIELHLSNMKRYHGLYPNKSWKPLIYTVENTGSILPISSCDGFSYQAARPGIHCPFQGVDTARVRASLLCHEPMLVFLFIPIHSAGELYPLRSSVSVFSLLPGFLVSSEAK
jgi:hypothetical protein